MRLRLAKVMAGFLDARVGSGLLDAAQQVARVDGSVESVVSTNPLSVHPT